MKKKIVANLILTMSLLGVWSTRTTEIYGIEIGGNTITTTNTSVGVGYSINLAKNEFVDYDAIKFDNPVLDMGWVNQQTLVKTNLNEYSTIINHSNSFEGIVEELETDANLSSSYSQNDSLLLGTAASRFDNIADVQYANYTYQYYSTYNYLFRKHSYALPDYATDLSAYKRALDDDYYNDVESLLYDELDATTFFDRYGTHVIAKGIFGGKLEINYSMATSRYDVWNTLYDSLTNYINTNLYNKVGTNTTINFDVFSAFSFSTSRAKQELEISTVGGDVSVTPSTSNLYTVYTDWLLSVSDAPFIIEASSDGLIPLWDLLPIPYDNDTYKDIFIEKYNEYTSSVESSTIANYYPAMLNDPTGVATGFRIVRPGEAIITDDGIYNQYYDVINLNSFFDLKFLYMKSKGFRTVDIYVQMKIREINSGTQIVAFYWSENEGDLYLIHQFEHEYGGTALDTEYGSTIGFVRLSIPMTTFEPSLISARYKLIVRYSATGVFEDDWANEDIYAQAVYHR